MSGPTFIPGQGRLATDRYDFQRHVAGTDFYHNADDITVIPGLTFNDPAPATDVYTALSNISAELAALALSGKGFITVGGDGYDTYHNSLEFPDAPYDAAIPAFDGYLNDVLNNPNNPLYFRIRDGGVVLIKAGTYKFTGTVDVPPGIILLGEGYGTKIVNQIASPAPLFKIKADISRISDAGIDSVEKFIFCKETILVNLTIADNFLVPKFLGDLSYKNPRNNDSIKPLVALEEGASLSCENVRFVGKTIYTLGVISNITSFAIATDGAVPVSTGTRLKIFNSSIDGFAVPIQFTPSGAVNNNFEMTNSLIRGYGFLNSDFVAASNNTILKLNACNAVVADNYCFGNDSTVTSLVFIIPLGSAPALQSKARIIVANNAMAIKRTSGSANSTFRFIRFSGALNSSLSSLVYGNNFDNSRSFTIAIDNEIPQVILNAADFAFTAGTTITLTSPTLNLGTGTTNLDSAIKVKTRVVSTSPYTVDAISTDYTLFVDTSLLAITINLPAHAVGRQLTIKDTSGNASVNNITLVRNGGTGNIEDVAGNKIISSNWAALTLVSSGTNWYFV